MQTPVTSGFLLRARMLEAFAEWEKSGTMEKPRELQDLIALERLMREQFGDGSRRNFRLHREDAERALQCLFL